MITIILVMLMIIAMNDNYHSPLTIHTWAFEMIMSMIVMTDIVIMIIIMIIIMMMIIMILMIVIMKTG